MLSNIWKKPLIQIHDKTILSMEFKSIIKARDSNSWQYYFINKIQPHNQSSWFKPMANYLSKAQYSLVTSKTPVLTGNIKTSNFQWQHQKAQFSLVISKAQFTFALFYQKPKIIDAWQKYYVIIISFKRWTMFLKHYYGINHGNHYIKARGKLLSFYKSSWKFIIIL